jgi:HD-GYP domain-containing protein (c-di-GMP phosphodiesterase class II)
MLKKIPSNQLRLGMHVHALEGSWLDHPFWKTRFVLREPTELRQLLDSGVKECWINVALGGDVQASESAPVAATVAALPAAPETSTPATAAKPAPKAFAEEIAQAAAICQRGRAAMVSMFQEARMGKAVDAQACQPLVEEITQSVWRNPGALVSLARLKTKDDYSYMHSVAVCALMIALGRQLGFDEARCRAAGLAGLLHDIGKTAIPLAVLNKPGKLTEDEFAIVRQHPQAGHALLLEGQGAGAEALDVCLHHHERIDGKGYPFGLASDAISQFARMGAVCDVYDAVTSNRPYKAGWDPAESIAQMASWKGHFDPVIFKAFVCSLGIYPTGSLVRLVSGKLAVVVEQNAQAIGSPVVKAFFSTKSNMRIPPLLIDLAKPSCNERIAARESPKNWDAAALQELWLPPEVKTRV